MGRTIVFENDDVVTVTGIMEDVPDNAHFTPKFVTSLVASPGFTENLDNWSNSSWFTYFVLMNGVDHAGFEEKLNVSLEELRYDEDDDDELSLYRLQALTSIHLHSHINFELSANNDIKYIYLFTAVAFLILLIACVNYMNLATARSIKRAREVGIRKVVGAYRFQLLIQYIGESVLLAFLALVLGLLLVYLLLPAFNQWLGKELSFGFSDHSQFYLILMGVTLGVGLISGSYPALFMSSLKPVSVLRGTFGRIAGGTRLQQYLMVGQQAVSIVLVVASIIIYRQLQYIQRKEVGYNREHVLVMSARDWDLGDRLQIFRDELMRDPNVINVALSSSLPTRISSQTTARKWEGSVEGDELPIYNARVNYDFIDVYEIEMVEGRNFSRDYPTDTTNAYILNETAVRSLGWEAGVGKQFDLWGNEGPVIGVVKDIHMHSLHMPIKPLLLYLDNDRANYVSVRIGSTDVPSTMSHIESTVKAFTPYPFEYTFLDETYAGLYRSEAKLGQCMGYFALLALLIASLGVFGMAAFSSEQRTKEIGVRKVLGASIPDILLLLSITYTKQVMVAFVIAIPVAYFVMARWLEEFAYRVTIHPVIFLVSLISIVLIAWCSVLYQSIRAARVNPVNSLRNE